jgi:hypothetical protein
VFAVLLLAPAAVCAQSGDDPFRAGLEARENKKWRDVVTQMRLAIQQSPIDATRKVRSGLGGLLRQGGTEYLPHYFLGEALFNLQDCAGAVEEWAKSEQQGAVRSRSDLLKALQDGYATCEMKGVLPPSKYDSFLARINQHITDVSSQATAVVRLGSANTDLWQGAQREQYDRAFNELLAARTRLESAAKTRAVADFNEATAAADRARAILTTLENTLNTSIAQRLSIQGQARDLEQLLGSADAFDRSIENRKTLITPALAEARQQGRAGVLRAREQLAVGVRTSSASTLNEARIIAQDGINRLKQVADELARIEREGSLRQLADAAARAHQAFSLVDNAFANLDRLTVERPAVDPSVMAKKDAVQRQVAAARRRLDAAIRAESLSGIVDASRLASDASTQLDDLISTFGPLTLSDRGVHPALIEGARRFFAGQYQEALAALHPEGGFAPDIPLQLHVHLFRAASAYALFLRSGETNQTFRDQVLAEITQCRQLDSTFEPDRRAFTPKFIAVYRTGTIPPVKTATPQ